MMEMMECTNDGNDGRKKMMREKYKLSNRKRDFRGGIVLRYQQF